MRKSWRGRTGTGRETHRGNLETGSGCSDPESRSQCITASSRTSIGKEGLTTVILFHLTCENDRWPVGHGVGSGFARLHCAVYAERNGET